jgi:hypothetical protein
MDALFETYKRRYDEIPMITHSILQASFVPLDDEDTIITLERIDYP